MAMENNQLVVDSMFDRIQARNGLVAKNQSQMNKLLPMLNLAAKQEVAPELIQQRLETQRDKLLEAETLVAKTIKSLAPLAQVDKATKMKKLTLGVKRLRGVLDSGAPKGTAKALKLAINEMQSIRAGVYTDQEMAKSEFKVPYLELAMAEVQGRQTGNNKLIQQLELKRQGVDIQEQEEVRLYEDFSSILETTKAEGSKSQMEAIRDQEWVVIRAPLIPMPKKGVLNPDRFKAAGFNCESMAGYPMFRSQLVIGINRNMLDRPDAHLTAESTDKEKAKARAAVAKAIPREALLKAAVKVKRIVEKQTGQRLFFVDERPHGAAGGSWFWLMSENQINKLAANFPGGQIQLLNFGFAF